MQIIASTLASLLPLLTGASVPGDELKEWDFDGSVRAIIEAQDRDIAERSGKSRGAIKEIVPAGGRAGGERAAARNEARNRTSSRHA